MSESTNWWIAVISTGATAMVFLGSMFTFFRGQRGAWSFRLILFASLLAALVAIFVPLSQRHTIGGAAFALGLVLLTLAQGLFWSAVRAHGQNRPSGAFALDPPKVITLRGPYRLVRHPFYVAYILGFAAGSVFTASPWVLIVPVWMCFLYAVAASQEERLILSSEFAAPYGAYMRRVGGLFPRIRIPPDSAGSGSTELL